MPIDTRLAQKGRKEPLQTLVQQGHYTVGLARELAVPLAEALWLPADTEALAADLAQLDTEQARRADARGEAKGHTAGQDEAVSRGKAFKRRLDLALPRVLRQTRVEGVTAEQFYAGEAIQRSVPRLAGWMTRVQGPVAQLAADLDPYFQPDGVVARLARLHGELTVADQTQEVALTALPADTQAVYERKGRVLEAIEDLHRAGKIAFDGDAAQIGRFNKDILLRGRKAKAAVAEPVPEPA